MINISIEPVNAEQVLRGISHIPGAVEKAARRAVTRTLKGSRKEAATLARRRYTLPAGIITSSLSIRVNGLGGELKSKGRRNPLEKAKVSGGVRQPVRAVVVRGQGGIIKRAFRMKFHPDSGIFQRVGVKRLPIEKLSTVAAPQMVSHNEVSKPVQDNMQRRLSINLLHEASAILGGF